MELNTDHSWQIPASGQASLLLSLNYPTQLKEEVELISSSSEGAGVGISHFPSRAGFLHSKEYVLGMSTPISTAL